MTVKELVEALGLKVFYMEEEDREIDGVYCGDLLSWVMGKCPADAAWVTIMSNQNVAAVAVLCDTACTILSENVQPDAELLERAEKQGVTLLGSEMDEYQLCWRLKEVLG
jgi:serine kinase of HPr protein (carbohydrate metabolism regulator)